MINVAKEAEKLFFLTELKRFAGNVSAIAEAHGISRRTVTRKIAEYRLLDFARSQRREAK